MSIVGYAKCRVPKKTKKQTTKEERKWSCVGMSCHNRTHTHTYAWVSCVASLTIMAKLFVLPNLSFIIHLLSLST